MKTAVDWFYEILTTENWEYKTYEEQDEIFKKVKEMEKQQMFEYIKQLYVNGEYSLMLHKEEFEKYYKQKYENERNTKS